MCAKENWKGFWMGWSGGRRKKRRGFTQLWEGILLRGRVERMRGRVGDRGG